MVTPSQGEPIGFEPIEGVFKKFQPGDTVTTAEAKILDQQGRMFDGTRPLYDAPQDFFQWRAREPFAKPLRESVETLDAISEVTSPAWMPLTKVGQEMGIIPESFDLAGRAKWTKDIARMTGLIGNQYLKVEDPEAVKDSFTWDEETTDALKDFSQHLITFGEDGVGYEQTVERLAGHFQDRPLAEQVVGSILGDPAVVGTGVIKAGKVLKSIGKNQFTVNPTNLFNPKNPITQGDELITGKLQYYAVNPKLNESLNAFDTIKNIIIGNSDNVQMMPIKTQKYLNYLRNVNINPALYIGEALTDQFTYINQLTHKAQKRWKKTHGKGVPFPDEYHAEMYFSLTNGAGSAAKYRIVETFDNMKRTLGKDIDVNYVNEFLKVRHLQDVLTIHPQKVISNSAYGNQQALANKISDMVTELGDEGFAKVEEAAGSIRDAYKELLFEMDRAKMLEPGLAVKLAGDETTEALYPWYNPTAYLDDLDQMLTGTSRVIDNPAKTRNPLRYITENQTEDLIQADPLSLVFSNVARMTHQIFVNNANKSLIKTLLYTGDAGVKLSPKKIRKTNIESEKLISQMDAREELFKGTRLKDLVNDPPPKPREEIVRAYDDVDRPNTISFVEDGKIQVYDVNDDALRMSKFLQLQKEGWVGTTLRRGQAPFKFFFVTGNPAFIGPALLADSLVTSMFNGLTPFKVGESVYKVFMDTVKRNPDLATMIKSGGDVSGFLGTDGQRILKRIEDASKETGDNALLITPENYKSIFTDNPLDTIASVGHRAEVGPRFAVFGKGVKDGFSNERAAWMGRNATVDFQRTGTLMKEVNKWFMYSNVAAQGAFMIPRKFGNKTTAKYASMGVTGLLTTQAALYLQNRQYPEYWDMPSGDRMKFSVMLPSKEIDGGGNVVPHYILPLPISREVQVFMAPFQKLLEELDLAFQKAGFPDIPTAERGGTVVPVAYDDIWKQFQTEVNPLSAIFAPDSSGNSTLGSAIAGPELARTVMDIYYNKNSYTNRPIVPEIQKGLPKHEQFDERTSYLSKRLSPIIPLMSPYQIDYAIQIGVIRDMFTLVDVIHGVSKEKDVKAERYAADLQNLQDLAQKGDDVNYITRTFYSQYLTEEFLDGEFDDVLDMENRIKQVIAEQEREEKTPFISTIMDRFIKSRGGQLYNTGTLKANQQFGTDARQNEQVQGYIANWFEYFGKPAVRQLEASFVEYNNDPVAYRNNVDASYSPQRFAQQIQDLKNVFRIGVDNFIVSIANNKENFKGIDSTDKERYAAWKEAIWTVGGAMEDRRSKARILAAGYKAIVVNDWGWAPQTQDPNVWISAHKDWPRYHAERDSYKDDIVKRFGTEVLDEMLLITNENKSSIEIDMDNARESFRDYYGVAEWLVDDTAKSRNYPKLVEEWQQYQARTGDARIGYKQDNVERHKIFTALESQIDKHKKLFLEGKIFKNDQGVYIPTPEPLITYQQGQAAEIERNLIYWGELLLGADGAATNTINNTDFGDGPWALNFQANFLE